MIPPITIWLDTFDALEPWWVAQLEGGAERHVDVAPEVFHGVDGDAVVDDGLDECVAGKFLGDTDRNRPTADDVARLIGFGVPAAEGSQVNDHDHIGPGGRAFPIPRHELHERVGRVGAARLERPSCLGILLLRRAPDPVALSIEPVHDRHADLGRQLTGQTDRAQWRSPVPETSGLSLAAMQLVGADHLMPAAARLILQLGEAGPTGAGAAPTGPAPAGTPGAGWRPGP